MSERSANIAPAGDAEWSFTEEFKQMIIDLRQLNIGRVALHCGLIIFKPIEKKMTSERRPVTHNPEITPEEHVE